MISAEQRQELIDRALAVRRFAYAPYSKYQVGASLLTTSGRYFDGVNIENAAYPTTICAERVAIFKAVSEGERKFTALAVATGNGGSPCGSCRQVMAEFNLDMVVLVINVAGEVVQEALVRDLLPGAFTPSSLLP
jgi:cytidine deaminase